MKAIKNTARMLAGLFAVALLCLFQNCGAPHSGGSSSSIGEVGAGQSSSSTISGGSGGSGGVPATSPFGPPPTMIGGDGYGGNLVDPPPPMYQSMGHCGAGPYMIKTAIVVKNSQIWLTVQNCLQLSSPITLDIKS